MNEKTLFLVRHAKSSWKDTSLSDHDRPLNQRGKQNALLMAARLKKRGILPKIIFSSTAKRASATAKIFAQEIGLRENQINYHRQLYHASIQNLITIIRAISDKFDSVMLCGHNPGFSELANYEWNLPVHNHPTCGVLEIRFKADSWNDIAVEKIDSVKFDYPKNSSSTPEILFS